MVSSRILSSISRRRFLASTAITAGAMALPGDFALAQSGAKFTRPNACSDDFPADGLDDYGRAVEAMLLLPPDNARNWYRLALTHKLDCPHANWWLLPWHRGYCGWMERICREVLHKPEFVLPYWDWTKQKRVPAGMFTPKVGALDPTQPPFLQSVGEFEVNFGEVLEKFWANLTADQMSVLSLRNYDSFAAFWDDAKSDFQPHGVARGLTGKNPNLSGDAALAVDLDTIHEVLKSTSFEDFGSHKSNHHSMSGTGSSFVGQHFEGGLEAGPHDHVHINVDGFMYGFLSPVDPLFYMHHANIDRLWMTWTRMEEAAQGEILPTGDDFDKWAREPFLFFVDENGNPAPGVKAGDYATAGDFDYDYAAGSGDEFAAARVARVSKYSRQTFAAQKLRLGGTRFTVSQISLPPALLALVRTESAAPGLVAQVTVDPPSDPGDLYYKVIVDPPADPTAVMPSSPHYAGSIRFFAMSPRMAPGPMTYTIMLGPALRKLGKSKGASATGIRIAVVPAADRGRAAPSASTVVSVTVAVL
jgi:tyrosinase